MCLILLAYRAHPDQILAVAANRDEFYARPSQAAHRWPDAPQVVAGRDLEAGGTWLGVTDSGRFAAVTNFSETSAQPAPASRGHLTRDFLTGQDAALDFAKAIQGADYAGFSLLLFDGSQLVYVSNRNGPPQVLAPGIYGLANTHLDGDWPKVRLGKAALAAALPALTPEAMLAILADTTQPPDAALPQRGRELAFERRVAPCFIRGEQYGTRASTALILDARQISLVEQGFGPMGAPDTKVELQVPVRSTQR